MKNAIAYYYNLYSYDIHQQKDIYKFTIANMQYVLLPCDITELTNAYDLSKMLAENGIYVHQIVPTTSNKMYITFNAKNYVLIQHYGKLDQKLKLLAVTNFNNSTININYEKITQPNWGLLWSNKIDYFEYQVNQFGKKHPIIRKSISYYIGLAETGISLYKNSKIFGNSQLTVCHKRIGVNSTLFDLYNPLNLVVDYKVRDVAEYFKELFLVKDDIFPEIIEYFQHEYLSAYDCFVFFIRMFYPSFYFDIYEQIIENKIEEVKLEQVIAKTDAYELLLKNLYFYLSKYMEMPDIEWLKKA